MSKQSEPPPPSYSPQQQGPQGGYPASGTANFPAGGQQGGGYGPPPPVQTYPPGGHGGGGGGYPGGPGVTVMPGVAFREHPVSIVCQHCHASITTQVTYDTGMLPWLVAGGLLLVGCWLGCCLIPFCIDGLKDAIHTCPQCNRMVGQYKRM